MKPDLSSLSTQELIKMAEEALMNVPDRKQFGLIKESLKQGAKQVGPQDKVTLRRNIPKIKSLFPEDDQPSEAVCMEIQAAIGNLISLRVEQRPVKEREPQVEVVKSTDGDWVRLYINGNLVKEGHSLDEDMVASAICEAMGLRYRKSRIQEE